MPAPMDVVSSSLGLSSGLGDMLNQQRVDETEEQRRKRLLDLQQRSQLSPMSSLISGPSGGLGPVSGGLLGR